MRQKDIRPAPARIEFKGMKFLITDRPSDATIQSYLMVSWTNSFSKMFLNIQDSYYHANLDTHFKNNEIINQSKTQSLNEQNSLTL